MPEVVRNRSVAAKGLAVPRSYIAWSAVGVLMAGAVIVVVDVERVRQWGSGAPEAVGFRGEVGGTVRSLDAKTRVVRIARGMLDYSSIPISVTTDSRVNIRGRLGAFGDLREGLPLSVCYEVTPAGRWARSIEMPPSSAPCGAVADAAAPSEPSSDDAVRPVESPVDAPARAALVTPPAPVVSRTAPTPTPASAGGVSSTSRRKAPAAQTRALQTGAEASRRPEPGTRSTEDYAAVIGWVLTERTAVARQSPTESALARPAGDAQMSAPGSPAASDATGASDAPIAAAPVGPTEKSQAVVPEVATRIAAPEHRSGGAAIAKPACPDIVDDRSRTKRIVDCVGGWLKGESEEFRDGFKRGIEEFRTAVENLERGFQRLGEKLRR